tara:strand:+ start:1063 stop:1305 length:243 start_codon:yes stop_codon:yes gene_type:complete
MATIYDEIKTQFKQKLEEETFKNEIISKKLEKGVFDFSINVLVKQIKELRKKNFQETRQSIGSDANELVTSIDQEITRNT